ncbi:N-acetylmuramoyl-L-alanine amidase [Branchiostoma belcheri]|nr:N-acetylmuramoyl-L-alanine amidase [Branchiostoma belcheri]
MILRALATLILAGLMVQIANTFAGEFPHLEAITSDVNATVGDTVQISYMYEISANFSDRSFKSVHRLRNGSRDLISEIFPNGSQSYEPLARLEDVVLHETTSYKEGLLTLTLDQLQLSDTAEYEAEVRVPRISYINAKVTLTVTDVPRCPYQSCPDGQQLVCQLSGDARTLMQTLPGDAKTPMQTLPGDGKTLMQTLLGDERTLIQTLPGACTVVPGGQIHVTVGRRQHVPPGGSVILPCNYSLPSDDVRPLVSWWKDRGLVLTRRIVYEHRAGQYSKAYDEWEGRTVLLRQASLQITNLTTNDTGKYECEIRVPLQYGAARGFINLDVSVYGGKNNSLGKLQAGFIVGVVVSGVVFILATAAILTRMLRNRKMNTSAPKYDRQVNM